MMTRRDPYVNMLRTDDRGRCCRHRRRRQHHRAAAHRRARPARRVRPPHRAQHAAHSARGIQSREGRRSGRRLRRHRGPDRQALRCCLGAVSGNRSKPAAPGRRSNGGLIQKNVAAVRAERQQAVARRKDALTGTSDFPDLSETAGRGARRRASGDCRKRARRDHDRGFAAHPAGRAIRSAARCIRPHACRKPARGRKCFSPISARCRSSPRARPSPRISTRPAASRRVSNDGFKDQAAMIAAFKESGAKLACLCSSDKVYAQQAAEAAKALTAAGAIVHLAGTAGRKRSQLAAGRREKLHLRWLRRAFDLAGRT